MPLALTDDQLTIVRRLAEPLQLAARAGYLERVAQLLRGQIEIGDGVVHRAAEQAQREFRRSPALLNGKPVVGSKYAR
jgi:hypothetical protein